MADNNGWEKHQLLVLAEIERLGNLQADTIKALQDLRIEFERLKSASTVKWGVLSAAIAASVSVAAKVWF